jgi:hypothetical protein
VQNHDEDEEEKTRLLRDCDIFKAHFGGNRRHSSEQYPLIYHGIDLLFVFLVFWAARLDTLCTFGLFPHFS